MPAEKQNRVIFRGSRVLLTEHIFQAISAPLLFLC